MDIIKYPRTRHIAGSRLQKGDEDLQIVPVESLWGRHVVVEEKQDGANSGISFDAEGNLYLQSRGHFLQGGPREVQFNLFKQWAVSHAELLSLVLGDRYIAYGEWMYSKHTVFYDALPHYWMEFDILDKASSNSQNLYFLDTTSRSKLLAGLPIVPVKVLWSGLFTKDIHLPDLIGPSHFITPAHVESLRTACHKAGQDFERVRNETDMTGLMEGLYIKVEEDGRVTDRFKFVRPDFTNKITEGGEHHLNRAIIPNLLKDDVDLFAENA
jgi:RNA ligase